MSSGESALINILCETGLPLQTRRYAVEELLRLRTPRLLEVLLQISQREGEPVEVLALIGTSIARLEHQGATVTEFDLRDARVTFGPGLNLSTRLHTTPSVAGDLTDTSPTDFWRLVGEDDQ